MFLAASEVFVLWSWISLDLSGDVLWVFVAELLLKPYVKLWWCLFCGSGSEQLKKKSDVGKFVVLLLHVIFFRLFVTRFIVLELNPIHVFSEVIHIVVIGPVHMYSWSSSMVVGNWEWDAKAFRPHWLLEDHVVLGLPPVVDSGNVAFVTKAWQDPHAHSNVDLLPNTILTQRCCELRNKDMVRIVIISNLRQTRAHQKWPNQF